MNADRLRSLVCTDVYVALIAAISMAAILIVGPPMRFAGPGFATLNSWLPARVWGIVWLVVGLHMAYGVLADKLGHARVAATASTGLFLAFATGIGVSTTQHSKVSLLGSVAYTVCAYLTGRCAARLAVRSVQT